MSPFLRWGIFSIVIVGALVYAYNASKGITEHRALTAPAASQGAPAVVLAQPPPLSPACAVEFAVAQRAREARSNGDPVDRLLRTQEIAFENDAAKRERLTQVARRWFEVEGDVDPTMLRSTVTTECEQLKPQ